MASCTHWGQDAAKNTLAPKNFKSDIIGRTGLEDHRNDFYMYILFYFEEGFVDCAESAVYSGRRV